jgi:hypothetical protein
VTLGDQAVDQSLRMRLEDRTELLQRWKRDDLVHQAARAIMDWRVSLEQQRRRTPRLLMREVAHAHPAARAERDMILEGGCYLGVAGHA